MASICAGERIVILSTLVSVQYMKVASVLTRGEGQMFASDSSSQKWLHLVIKNVTLLLNNLSYYEKRKEFLIALPKTEISCLCVTLIW